MIKRFKTIFRRESLLAAIEEEGYFLYEANYAVFGWTIAACVMAVLHKTRGITFSNGAVLVIFLASSFVPCILFVCIRYLSKKRNEDKQNFEITKNIGSGTDPHKDQNQQ